MKTIFLKGLSLLSGGRASTALYDVAVSDGIITDVKQSDENTPLGYLAAGFVDIHTHGNGGHDFSSCSEKDLVEMTEWYNAHGVTHFAPTFVATPLPDLDKRLNTLYSYAPDSVALLPAHLEGPFISKRFKGAQPEKNISEEYKSEDASFFKKNADKIGIVTLCPTVKNSLDLTRLCSSLGIKTQVGHSSATNKEILPHVEEGLDGVTHIYCGCSGAERGEDFVRRAGVVETALDSDDLFVEVIADGIHLDIDLVKFVIKCKGYHRVILVSDSLSCAGMEEGYYKLGDDDVYTDGKACYRADHSGLAGSVISLADSVKLLVSHGIPLAEATYMASEAPRKYIGLSSPSLTIGETADFVVLSADGTLLSTLNQLR